MVAFFVQKFYTGCSLIILMLATTVTAFNFPPRSAIVTSMIITATVAASIELAYAGSIYFACFSDILILFFTVATLALC